MKYFERFLLLTIALALDGGLGYFLLPDSDPIKLLAFFAACLLLGALFAWVDRHISKKQQDK